MLRAFSIITGAVLLATGLPFAGSPHAGAAVSGSGNDDRLMRAYAQVWTGMAFSQLASLGFDAAKAQRWVSETRKHDNDHAELAMARIEDDKTKMAYNRTEMLEKRRKLMDTSGRYCAGTAGAKVVSIWTCPA
jgi:hypothetical protein